MPWTSERTCSHLVLLLFSWFLGSSACYLGFLRCGTVRGQQVWTAKPCQGGLKCKDASLRRLLDSELHKADALDE